MWKVFVAVLVPLAVAASACGGGASPKPSPTAAASTQAASATATVAKELDSGTILTQNKNSVVKILVTVPQGVASGSGVVWGDATHVLTNAHVVVGGAAIKVVDPNDGSRTFPAKVVALSSCDDVALLLVDRGQNLKPAVIGDSDTVTPGSHVISLGFPGTLAAGPNNAIVTEGSISRVHATFNYFGQRDLLQNTAPINPGNSGGPLFNTRGEVIGLNSYSVRGSQSENYAISINEAKLVAEKLRAGKNLDYIGISIEVNDAAFAQQNGFAYSDGLAIMAVDPGSPADKAKPYPLQYGNLIFEVNGTSVKSVGDYCDILRSHSSGDTLTIRFGAFDQSNKPFSNFQYQVVLP